MEIKRVDTTYKVFSLRSPLNASLSIVVTKFSYRKLKYEAFQKLQVDLLLCGNKDVWRKSRLVQDCLVLK